MLYRYRNQPWKGICITYELLITLIIRLPIWMLLAMPRSWRPRESWTIKRTVLIKLIRFFTVLASKVGTLDSLPNHLAITPGPGVIGIWVEPTPHLVTGKLQTWMTAASVSPLRIPGYWTHAPNSSLSPAAPASPGEKVLYHLHGGGYVRLSAHPCDATAIIPRAILQHVPSIQRAFSLEYRLSCSAPFPTVNPFPTALLDALAGYAYLVNDIGFRPADIIIVGDSAGGNLALALTRYLIEHSSSDVSLPAPPGRLLLLSPWCDFSVSHEAPTASSHVFAASDYIHPSMGGLDWAKDSFLGPFGHGAAVFNPYISPSSLDPSMSSLSFAGFPKTFIAVGGAEILYDQIQTLLERMRKDLGEGVICYEAPDAVHDYLSFEWHEPERTDTLNAIVKWMEIPL